MDVRSQVRFQPLNLPPLYDAENADILVPKYHTLGEGLIEMMTNPPTDLYRIQEGSGIQHYLLLREVLDTRIQPPENEWDDGWSEKQEGKLLSVEQDILKELQTEKATWCISVYFKTGRPPNRAQVP